jgi:hypothetical protein
MVLRNVGVLPQYYRTSQPRRSGVEVLNFCLYYSDYLTKHKEVLSGSTQCWLATSVNVWHLWTVRFYLETSVIANNTFNIFLLEAVIQFICTRQQWTFVGFCFCIALKKRYWWIQRKLFVFLRAILTLQPLEIWKLLGLTRWAESLTASAGSERCVRLCMCSLVFVKIWFCSLNLRTLACTEGSKL